MRIIKAALLFVCLYIWSVLISPIKCLIIAYRKVNNRQHRPRSSDNNKKLGPPRFTGPSHDEFGTAPHKKRRRRGHRGGRKHKRKFAS